MDVGVFRTEFPEFADTARFTNSMIDLWSSLAEKMLNASRWGTLRPMGINLFVAHSITLASTNANASQSGGTPGGASGITSSKSVGTVSVGYDTASAMEKDAGHWNQTTYGRQYLRLARMIGQGAVQL